MKSPSKFLGRRFLRELRRSHYVSPRGLEYEPCEVDYLLMEKEERLAQVEAERRHLERFREGEKEDAGLQVWYVFVKPKQ